MLWVYWVFLGEKSRRFPAAIQFPAALGRSGEGEMFDEKILTKCFRRDHASAAAWTQRGQSIRPQLTESLSGSPTQLHALVESRRAWNFDPCRRRYGDMNGDGFSNTVKVGQTVKKGDLLLTMDLDKIHAAGHAATVIMAVTNSDDFSSVDETGSGSVQPGDGVLLVVK